MLLQQLHGEQADEVIALDEGALGVEEKAAVKIAVPSETEVRAVGAHRIRGRRAVSGSSEFEIPCGKCPSGS